MSDLRQTLTDVLSGKLPPEKFLEAVDEFLAQPEPNLAALRSAIDAAEHLGLDADIAAAARERITDPDDESTEIIGSAQEKTVLTTNQQPTQLRGDPADVDPDKTVSMEDDRTVQVSADDDRTVQVSTDDDRTEQVSTDDDRTVQAPDSTLDPFAMATQTATPAGGPELGPGSVLKERFRLEQVIGQGGMGAVYKAVDLLKVEARDRNPYIAVKLLIGDFKEHPEAFIALQRESAKAQRLAHPNIATVYDFDRDGETVYMTMELMVGAELAKYIKKLPAGGLPVDEANRVIEQLCAGLQYAHGRGLVHSDFKPGNAFVLEDGTVKLLDFGIARASKTKADAEGEATVFDPGQLGALTPAYATIEMFEGEDPDPRDDIYALACVSYELYTGKHPFNKMSAVKARDKGLKPAPVAKLTKRQNRALLKGLALTRDERTPSVEDFWEGLQVRKDRTLQIAGAAVAGILLVGVLSYGQIVNFIHEREYAAIITEIDSGDDARLVSALEQIDALPEERQRVVADRARDQIIEYFELRAEDAIDESAGRYNYAEALAEIDELDRYAPDSAQVAQIRQSIIDRRNSRVATLRGNFQELLDDERILPDEDAQDITDVVAILRVVEPDNPLLDDTRLSSAYTNLVNTAIQNDNWDRAADILEVGLDYAPRNPDLLDLDDRVSTELRRRQEAALVASLRQSLRDAAPRTLDEFHAVRDELRQLMELRPADDLARSLGGTLMQVFTAGLASAAEAGNWEQADALLADFSGVLALDYLVDTRRDLTARQVRAGYDMSGDAERVADLDRRAAELRALIAEPAFDDEFSRRLTREFKAFTARLTPDTDQWETLRTEIANVHIERARTLIAENRFGVATNTLDQGELFHSTLPEFGTQRETLAAAEAAFRAEQARREESDRIDAAKQLVLAQVDAGELVAAERGFRALEEQLPADDPFITSQGPAALAEGYTTVATQAGERNEYATAVQFARAGLRVLPDHEPLQDLLTRYQNLARRAEVTDAASSLRSQGFAAFRRLYEDARESLPNAERGPFERDVATALSQRMTALDRGNELTAANELKARALELFPGNQIINRTQLREPERPSEYAPRVAAAIDQNNLTEARRILAEGTRAEPGHSELANFPGRLDNLEREANGLFAQANDLLRRGNRNGAQAQLEAALDIWADNPQYLSFRDQNFRVTTTQRADDGSRPCTENLATLGTSGRAICFDMVAGSRAPSLVVVPGQGGNPPYAIGKYEVMVNEWNHYCSTTGTCQPKGGDIGLPVTGITAQQADAYVNWLSETTGRRYRIPSDAEWTHAAGGGGNPGSSGDNNCRVVQGGNVIKGRELLRVNTGSDNGWGLRNQVGNAREWTRSGGSLLVRGGAHTDSLSDCSVGLSEPHGGEADAVTGFRVVRDVDN